MKACVHGAAVDRHASTTRKEDRRGELHKHSDREACRFLPAATSAFFQSTSRFAIAIAAVEQLLSYRDGELALDALPAEARARIDEVHAGASFEIGSRTAFQKGQAACNVRGWLLPQPWLLLERRGLLVFHRTSLYPRVPGYEFELH